MELQLAKDSATKNQIQALLLYEEFQSNLCWRAPSNVKKGLKKINGKKNQVLASKDMITIYVKVLGWNEYSTPWSQGGVHFNVSYL